MSVSGKPERRRQQATGRPDRFDVVNESLRQLSLVLCQGRFWVEEVDLAGATGHEELDHGLGLTAEVRRAGRQVGGRPMVRGHHPWQVAAEQSGETDTQ